MRLPNAPSILQIHSSQRNAIREPPPERIVLERWRTAYYAKNPRPDGATHAQRVTGN